MALTANRGSDYAVKYGKIHTYPVAAGVHIYRFAMCTLVAGYVQPAENGPTDAKGQLFVGSAQSEVDNTSGGAGAKTVEVRADACVKLQKAAASQADVGKFAVVLDDESVQLYQVAGSANICVGRITELLSTVEVMVDLLDRPVRVVANGSL